MTPVTLKQLREELENQAKGAAFAKAFAEGYFAVAFGTTPKSEIDQLVFDSLVKVGLINPDGAIYDIARMLKVTPAKARSILFQYQLRHDDAADLDQRVLKTLSQAKFSLDDKRLNFGIESPLIRSVIEARLKAAGVFSDISMSGEILKVPVNQLGVFIKAFVSDERAEKLRNRLDGVKDDKGLIAALNTFGEGVAADLAKDAAKDGAKAGLSGLFGWLAGNAGPGVVGEIAGEVSMYFDQV
ncbi:MAG: hypothetical protein ACK534_10730 [Phenylobacterium sp.]|jgi:hypothetical protein|uniref:hypothetical protein n=1 Tax=Phenylobacterium sp. TaxID=1871053 RepID=UPI00391F9BB8